MKTQFFACQHMLIVCACAFRMKTINTEANLEDLKAELDGEACLMDLLPFIFGFLFGGNREL